MNKRPLFAMAIGFVLGEVCAWRAESGRGERGIFLLADLRLPVLELWLLGFGAVVLLLGVIVLGIKRIKWKKSGSMHKILWMLLLLCVFGVGYGRMVWEFREWDKVESRIWEDGEVVELRGKVEEVREKEKSTAVTIKTEEAGKVLVYMEKEGEGEENIGVEELRIGEMVKVKGECSRFEEAANPGQFDLKAYYRSQGISAAVFAWDLERENTGSYSPYLDALYRFRRFCSRIFTQICEPEDEGIFRAAILGEKEGMDQEIKDLYQKNGISHLLAISGLHLSLIGAGLHKLLRRCGLGYGASGCLAAAGIFSYGILTGASGSAMRAVIMLLVSFLAAYLGRTYDLLSALSLAALLLAGARPFSITQSGFQLSFGAVLGIGLVGKALEKGMGIESNWIKGVVISLSVQLATAPVVLWHYFQIPVYGVVLNLVVVPLMGYVVISGLMGLGTGMFSLWLGVMAVGTGHYILRFYQWLCELVSRFPGYLLIWGRPDGRQIFLYYLFLGGMIFLLNKGKRVMQKEGEKKMERGIEGDKKRDKKEDRCEGWKNRNENKGETAKRKKILEKESKGKIRNCVIFAAGMILCVLTLKPRPQSGLDIAVLDVGQGDGTVLQCEGGEIEIEGISWMGEEGSEKEGRTEKVSQKKRGKIEKSGRIVILMDGGSTSDKRLGENRLEPYLKSEGISRIDFAVVSHGDEDHISGLRYLLKECLEIDIGCLILPEAGMGDTGYEKLIAAAERKGVPVGYMDAGDWIQAGACRLTCFYPGKGMEADFSDRNQQSLVIRADYQDFHMLFTGDVGQEGELMALDYGGEEEFSLVQVLKAAHHGSRFSSGEEFLAAVHPAWTVISYGEENSYGHPHEETLERLQEEGTVILETGKMGAVLLHVEGGKVWYWGFR